MPTFRRVALGALTLMLGLLLLEGFLSVLWLVPDYRAHRDALPRAVRFKEDFHAGHDPEIGWSHLRGTRIPDFYGPGRGITINDDGLRGLENYVGRNPTGRFRTVFLGDSFTLGYGVDDRATYPAVIESLNPAVQAVNMGQGGYSVGQCWLWYRRDGAQLDAGALVFAFLLDDVWRMAGERTDNGYAKPAFDLEGDRLVVRGTPLPGKVPTGRPLGLDRIDFLTDHSALFRTAERLLGRGEQNPEAGTGLEQVRVALAIFDEVLRLTRDQDIPLVLALLPSYRDVTQADQRQNYRSFAAMVAGHARDRGIPFLDLSEGFFDPGGSAAAALFLDEPWHHYNEAGQRHVARQMDAGLRRVLPGYPDGDGAAADQGR